MLFRSRRQFTAWIGNPPRERAGLLRGAASEIRRSVEELIVEVEKDFLIQSEKLRKFYGHH